MSEQEDLSPAERELEAALRSLTPVTAKLDLISAAFSAGKRSARRQVWMWQSAAAAMLLVSAGAWLIPVRQQGIEWRQGIASTPLVTNTSPPPPRAEQSLLMLQQAVWKHGVDGLPTVQLPAAASGPSESFSIHRGES